MNYTYDEEGVAFYYFLITVLTIYPIPATFNRLFQKRGTSPAGMTWHLPWFELAGKAAAERKRHADVFGEKEVKGKPTGESILSKWYAQPC